MKRQVAEGRERAVRKAQAEKEAKANKKGHFLWR
jgi:hypothetical protein